MEHKVSNGHYDIKQASFIEVHSALNKVLINGYCPNNLKDNGKSQYSKNKDIKLIHWQDFYNILSSWHKKEVNQNELKNFFRYCQHLEAHENKNLYVNLADKYFLYRYLPLISINNMIKRFNEFRNRTNTFCSDYINKKSYYKTKDFLRNIQYHVCKYKDFLRNIKYRVWQSTLKKF